MLRLASRPTLTFLQWAAVWFRFGENLSQLHQCPKDEAQNLPGGWCLGDACLRETSGHYKFAVRFSPTKPTRDHTGPAPHFTLTCRPALRWG